MLDRNLNFPAAFDREYRGGSSGFNRRRRSFKLPTFFLPCLRRNLGRRLYRSPVRRRSIGFAATALSPLQLSGVISRGISGTGSGS